MKIWLPKKFFLGLFLLVFGLASAPLAVFAKNRVSYSLLPATLQEEVKRKYPEKDLYSLSELDEMLKWIHRQWGQDPVQLLRNSSGVFEFKTVPTPRLKSFKIEGEKFFSEGEILAIFNVTLGQPLNTDVILENAQKLQKAYQDAGFLSAVIEMEFPAETPNQVDVVAKISENRRTLIQEIHVLSSNTELNQKLERRLKNRLKKPLTDAQVAELQKTIRDELAAGKYFRAEISDPVATSTTSPEDVSLSFRLDKVNRYSVTLNGYNEVSSRRLDNILDLEHFYSSNPSLASELAARVKAYYLSLGFARVEVQGQESPGREPFTSKIQIDIQEGPRVIISQIQFSGRLSRDSSYYADLLKKNANELIQDGYYNKEDFEASLNKMKIELQNQGFLLAKSISTRTQYSKTKDQLTIFVNFDEGPRTELSEIKFVGNKSISDEELLKIIEIQPGGPLQLNRLEEAIRRLRSTYQDRGYLEYLLVNEKEDLVTYDETNTKARVLFNIYEGPRVEVASILVEGNSFSKEKIILIELEFKENEILTPSKIEESIARLQRTGHFTSIEIKTLEEKTNVSQRTVIVRVTEANPGQFTMGFGATNERELTLRGYTGIAYRSIGGTGRGVSLRVEGNYNVAQIKFLETKTTLGYLEPYLFDTRVRFRTNISLSRTVSDFSNKTGTDTNQYTYSVEKDFTSHITGIYDLLNLAQSNDFNLDSKESLRRLNIASTGPTVDIDYRDNIFNPTKGSLTRLNVEYASPALGSSETVEYYKLFGSFTHHTPFAPRWVWVNSVRGGYLENLSTRVNGGVPYDKKGFILGGRSTIRGFETGTNETLPSLSDLGITNENDFYKLTSSATMSMVKSEVQFPLYGNIGGSVFYDGGYVKISGLPFKDNYRDAAGVGLRYITPVGSINLEVGFKLDRKENETSERFHFSVGTF